MADDSLDFWVYVRAVAILAAMLGAFFLVLGIIIDFVLDWSSWWTPLATFLFLVSVGTVIALFSEFVGWVFNKAIDGFHNLSDRRKG